MLLEEGRQDRMVRVGQDCQYLKWISNVVLVKKPNDAWRMCVDFIDLNKDYPKDSYPLSNINKLVDATTGHAVLSFMDTFLGPNWTIFL